jgi:hypothetical protein
VCGGRTKALKSENPIDGRRRLLKLLPSDSAEAEATLLDPAKERTQRLCRRIAPGLRHLVRCGTMTSMVGPSTQQMRAGSVARCRASPIEIGAISVWADFNVSNVLPEAAALRSKTK